MVAVRRIKDHRVYESLFGFNTASRRARRRIWDYQEKSLTANINQLISRDWSLGARYRVSDASLHRRLSAIAVDKVFEALQKDDGLCAASIGFVRKSTITHVVSLLKHKDCGDDRKARIIMTLCFQTLRCAW
jgi:hypothetical protein